MLLIWTAIPQISLHKIRLYDHVIGSLRRTRIDDILCKYLLQIFESVLQSSKAT